MTASITEGLRAAARHPKLVLLTWAWYGLLALVPTLPAWAWWNAVLGYSPEGASVLRRFDLGVFLDLTRSEGASGLSLLMAAAAAAGIIALVSSAFVFGGVLEVLGSEDERRSLMHRVFRGGGHFFWRFVRLALMAIVCLVLVTGAVSALMGAITSPMKDSEWEPAGYLAGLVSILVVVVVAAFFLIALDYARIRVARDDSRSMLRAYFGGLGFVLRHLFATYVIAIAVLAALAVLMALCVAYETKAPAAGTWGAIVMLFVLQQAVVFGRVFLRVTLIGAERHFHMMALPKPVFVVSAEPPAPAVDVPPPSASPRDEQIPT
jgi:hypothetical protein